jgi:hypothetical protein
VKAPDGLTNEQRGTCIDGHTWIPENLFRRPSCKSSRCRQCQRDRDNNADKEKRRERGLKSGLMKTQFWCGHPATAENTHIYRRGSRVCLTCLNQKREGKGVHGWALRAPDGMTNEERGTCIKGHPWIEENKRYRSDGKMQCGACCKERAKAGNKYESAEAARAATSAARIAANRARPNFGCGHPQTPENTKTWPSKIECKTCHDAREAKRRGPGTGTKPQRRRTDCAFCHGPLSAGRRVYCCDYHHMLDDPSGYKGRCRQYGVPYEPVPKKTVFEHDGYKCQHCGKMCRVGAKLRRDRPTVDHIVPLSIGPGSPGHVRSNLQTLCGHCNGRKGASVAREPKLANATGFHTKRATRKRVI